MGKAVAKTPKIKKSKKVVKVDDPPRKTERKKKFSDERIIEALKQAHGFYSLACEALGCSRQALYKRISNSEELKQAVEEIEERHLDIAENALLIAIQQKQPWAIKFFLSLKGKNRGYAERHEIEVKSADQEVIEKLTDEQLQQLLSTSKRKHES